MRMSAVDWIAAILTIIGGLNWGLIGFMGFNLVSSIFGEGTAAERVVYSLVGLAALYQLIRLLFRDSAAERVENR
ncbi:MAG TPA: DUF378 domain-containing protein [Firmicutes bacterium]|jgi:uncharacterized membrane protein YuzA (DUF378 family)|nr:DUF378 domain-containing protein [Candidatus Fermentithermobacillaceae bacterium]